MALQNRVTPWGRIVATPERGLLMGNRGCLHDGDRRLVKAWARLPWVTCLLSFNGRHRKVMTPGQYTELFFLDEATALAAGHRPCATCRREAYSLFKEGWVSANSQLAGLIDGSIASVDRLLHAERVDASGRKRTWSANLIDLPDGTIIVLDDDPNPLLVREGRVHPWTPGGYGAPWTLSPRTRVTVLTPPSIVRLVAHGYPVHLHPSVDLDAKPSVQNIEAQRPRTLRHIELRNTTSPRERPVTEPRAPQVEPAQSPTTTLYRLSETPRGSMLYTYFAAILSVTDMDKGAAYPLKRFLGNFSGHEKAGRIEKTPGGYRLTRAGMDYFADRFRPGNPQHVNRSNFEAMAKLIRSGKAPGWVPVD